MSQPKVASSEKPTVATRHAFSAEMAKLARLPRTLRGGTLAMREAKDEFAPKSPAESVDAYDLRMKRSFLFGAYEDITDGLAAKTLGGEVSVEPPKQVEAQPASKPKGKQGPELPVGKPEISAEVKAWLEDFDLQGTTFEEFLVEAFREAIDCGLVHALVDHPRVPKASTLEEELRSGARPYATLIRGDDVLQKDHRRVAGRERLLRVNIFRVSTESDGVWGEKTVESVLVLRAGDAANEDTADESARWATWEEFLPDEQGNWPEVASSQGNLRPHVEIPLRTFYTRRTGFLRGRPALLRIAEKNCEHWQSSSHQRYNLDHARFSMLFRRAFKETERAALKSGASVIWGAQDPQSDMKVVETTGAALQAGRQHLEDCKAELALMSLEPMVKLNSVTATQVAVEKGEAENQIDAWRVGLQRFAQELLLLFARWQTPVGADPKVPGVVRISGDSALMLSAAQLEFIKFLAQQGAVRDETLLRVGKEIGALPAWLEPAVEVAAMKTEAPKLLGGLAPLLAARPAVPEPKPVSPGEPAPAE